MAKQQLTHSCDSDCPNVLTAVVSSFALALSLRGEILPARYIPGTSNILNTSIVSILLISKVGIA